MTHSRIPARILTGGLAALLCAWPWGGLRAAEAQWEVVNAVSATVVPLYNNEASPFPLGAVAVQVSDTGPTPEEARHSQLITASLQEARKQVTGPDALRPDLSGIQCNGVLQGPQGWSILCNGKWYRQGAKFHVPTKISDKAEQALAALAAVDNASADDLRQELATRAVATTLAIAITRIASQTMVVGAQGQNWQMPIRQSGD